MKEKLTIGAIGVLTILAIGLVFVIRKLPDVSGSVRNEISLLSAQNRNDYQQLKDEIYRLIDGPAIQQKNRVLEAGDKAQLLLDSLSSQFDRAIATGNTVELQSWLGWANTSIDTSLLSKETPLSFGKAQALLTQAQEQASHPLRTLALEHVRFEIHSVLAEYIMVLNQWTAAANLHFDRGFPQRPESWKKGKISIRVPTVMELEDTYRIEIRISKELEAEILQQLTPSEKIVIDSLWVGDIMVMRLQGEHFSIVNFDEEEQGVLSSGYTQWEYDVKPLKTGRHKLLVKVGIVYHVPNLGPTRKYFPVHEVEIDIEVSPVKRLASFATDRWEFLVSTILIPLLTLLYGRIRKQRRPQQEIESPTTRLEDGKDE